MQTIPNATWTKVTGSVMEAFQNSGANSWIDVDENGKVVFGPADSWAACQYSGDAIDLSEMTPGVAITIDWR